MPSELAAKVSEVSKFFGDFAAVSELSFEVPSGIIFGILGPNGAGKSTTLRMLNDIIAPDRGTIELLGRFAPGLEAARYIGYLPEERGLYPKMRVGETLEFFAQLRGLVPAEAHRRAGEWLERLSLSEWSGRMVQDLSKGMQQKVQFASALIHDPRLLILDEPWSGLDPLNADVLRDIVLEHKNKGHTVLFSTHLMEQAEKICDRVCIIAHGRKVLEGELGALRRAATPVGLVAVELASDEDSARARSTLFADPELTAHLVERGDHFEVQLVRDVSPDRMLHELVSAGLSVRRFELLEPSLHEIFIEQVAGAAMPRSPRGADG